jgi:hypothetical protein
MRKFWVLVKFEILVRYFLFEGDCPPEVNEGALRNAEIDYCFPLFDWGSSRIGCQNAERFDFLL